MKLRLEEISYAIGSKTIVDKVSAAIAEGQFVGLAGPNGCGKSTLLKTIYRAYAMDGGAAYIDGKALSTMTNRELAREMAVMQQENHIEFDMRVYDMVMLGRFSLQKSFGNDMVHEGECVRRALATVGLAGYEDRLFFSLSGGEKQRTLLARALVQETPLILLDEPTNHLDIGYQYQMMHILKEQQKTVFTAIHDLNIAACYCDQIVLMKQGKVMEMGTPEELLTPEKLHFLFGVHTKVQTHPITHKPHVLFIPNEYLS